MNATRRLLLVVVCALGVLVVAATFPAADPRLDAPGQTSAETGSADTGGDWESVMETPERSSDGKHNETTIEEDDIELSPVTNGDLVPGEIARVGVAREDLIGSDHQSVTMLVDGEDVGQTDADELTTFRVPESAEEFNVTVSETGDSVMVPTETAVEIAVKGHLIPGDEAEVRGTIGEYQVDNATVLVDGEAVGTTRDSGSTVVELPETARPVEIRLEREALSGEHTFDVPEPDISFTHPVIFPGMPAHVSVTADGAAVEHATVTVGDEETTTGDSGTTWVQLPLSDEVTANATVGAEQASRTVSDLYLRTTAVVLVVPGLLLGATWTYLRYVPHRHRRRVGISGPMLRLAALLGSLSTAITSAVVASLAMVRAARLPQPRLSGFRLPRPSLSFPAVGSFSLGFPSFGGLADLLTSPGSSRDRSLSATIKNAVTSDDGVDESDTDTESAASDEEPSAVEKPEARTARREELRDAWHTFLDHVDVRNRETWTPGEASRYALAAGYPRESVRRLLSLFRDAEYGTTEPSPEDVTEAQAAVETLSQHDPEEDSK